MHCPAPGTPPALILSSSLSFLLPPYFLVPAKPAGFFLPPAFALHAAQCRTFPLAHNKNSKNLPLKLFSTQILEKLRKVYHLRSINGKIPLQQLHLLMYRIVRCMDFKKICCTMWSLCPYTRITHVIYIPHVYQKFNCFRRFYIFLYLWIHYDEGSTFFYEQT